jgi:spermidine synthase
LLLLYSNATTSALDCETADESSAQRENGGMHGRARLLGVTVFLTGFSSLATEMAASRLLAPFFGSSNVVWANVIGLMLAFLALGYWIGGRVADARPSRAVLGAIVIGSGLTLAAVPFVARPLLRDALHGFGSLSVGVVVGSFFAVLALFAIPVVAMGSVTPFSLRLALGTVAETGRVAGRLYALSTIGSILGTFWAALIAIPLIGTQRTMLISALLLGVAAVPLLPRVALAAVAAGLALTLLPPAGVKRTAGVLWEGESAYQYIRVLRSSDGSRALELNEGIAQQSVWYPHTVLTGGYWDLFDVMPLLLGRQPHSVLVVGDAGGTIPRAYAKFFPQAHVDGVELDPAVTSAARRYLALGAIPTLRTITADGRVYLEGTGRRYDVIVVDAYRQPYIPFQLATEQFFQLARRHLRPGGLLALNVAATPHDHGLTNGVAASLAAAFPQIWLWRALRFSDLVFALDYPTNRATLVDRARTAPRALQPLVPLFTRELSRLSPRQAPWTDDRAPVEWITDRMLARQIASGQGLDEHYLPTAPP